MQILAGWARVAAIGLVGIVMTAGTGRPQQPGAGMQRGGADQQGIPDPRDPFGQKTDKSKVDDATLAKNEATLSILRNEERQKRLISDSDKLLQLATQLHADVSKTDSHILSVDVVKRAEEIEKLAKSVKDRMKGST